MSMLRQLDSLGTESAILENYRRLEAAGYGTESDEFRPDLATDLTGPEYFGLEAPPLDSFDELGGWNPIKAVTHAVSSVASNIPVVSSALKTPQMALAIARGKNVAQTIRAGALPPLAAAALDVAQGKSVPQVLKGAAQQQITEARSKGKQIAKRAAFIPGLGTAGAAALAAAAAASEGKDLRKIAEEAAISAVPGGQFAREGLSTAIDVARGGNVAQSLTTHALNVARTQIPGGEFGQRAFDVARDVARGRNVAGALASEAHRALSSGIVGPAAANLPFAQVLRDSPLVKVGPNGASFQFPGVGVPPAAALATTNAVAEAVESSVPGVAAAARQVIANTRTEANSGNKAAAAALDAFKQTIGARIALRQAKAQMNRLPAFLRR